jgi:hypothetical protein
MEPTLAPTSPQNHAQDDELGAEAHRRVTAFLRVLGVREDADLKMLADHCLRRARQRVRDAAGDELNRRALEEARRQHDRWLQHNLKLSAHPSAQELGKGRTSKLLGGPPLGLKDLQIAKALTAAEQQELRAVFPTPTPPEAPLPMPKQHLTFFAFGTAIIDAEDA